MHIVLRRNRESCHRYLLTRPGELLLRPQHQSPLENLCLAGAWVRNEFALPCVDAAAEGAIKAAELIATRALASRRTVEMRRFARTPGGEPLVLPPPYYFPRTTGSLFLLDANPERLAEAISPDLKLFPGFGGRMLFAVLRHEDVHAQCDPSGARYAYNEVLLAAFVREKRRNPIAGMGLYPICLYVDDDTAMAVGREVYGFPKKMARIEAGAHEVSLLRCGLSPDVPPGRVLPIKVMRAHWSATSRAAASPPAAKPPFSIPLLDDLVRQVLFYNTRHLTHPGARDYIHADLSQLTKVALADVEVRRVSSLRDFHLRVDASVTDPVYLLMPADPDGAGIRVAWGVKVELAFSMGAARIADDVTMTSRTPPDRSAAAR
jgi:hypothetical protein